MWKEAFKTADGDRKVLNKTVLKLERSIDALKVRASHTSIRDPSPTLRDPRSHSLIRPASLSSALLQEDNPLILCLIDGDGNIFSSDLIKQGQFGGRQAAALLTKGLTDYIASVDPAEASFPGRGQIWLTIYLNKSGLLETLTSNLVCTAEEFEAFVLGFNQASPLFSIVDVGNGKEAADSKIKGASWSASSWTSVTIGIQSVSVSSRDSLRLQGFSLVVRHVISSRSIHRSHFEYRCSRQWVYFDP